MAIVHSAGNQDITTYSPVTSAEVVGDIQQRIGRYFTRAEPRRRFMAYLTGLLSEVKRKNGCSLAEYAQDITPDGMQRLLTTAKWDAGAIRDELHNYVKEQFGDPRSLLVVGQAAFAKRGCHSAGVKKQFNEDSQRVERKWRSPAGPGWRHACLPGLSTRNSLWRGSPRRNLAAPGRRSMNGSRHSTFRTSSRSGRPQPCRTSGGAGSSGVPPTTCSARYRTRGGIGSGPGGRCGRGCCFAATRAG